MKWVRRVIVAAVLLGVAAAIGWSFVPRPVPVDTAPVERGPFEATVDADGVTRVRDRYVVSATLAARMERIEVHPGDPVEQGRVVARLLPTDPPLLDAQAKATARARLLGARAGLKQAQALVERARAAREQAGNEVRRARGLVAGGAIAAADVERLEMEERARARELDSARFGAGVAAHEVELAEAALLRTQRPPAEDEVVELRAPVGGVV